MLKAGANPIGRSSRGITPAELACAHGKPKIVSFIVDAALKASLPESEISAAMRCLMAAHLVEAILKNDHAAERQTLRKTRAAMTDEEFVFCVSSNITSVFFESVRYDMIECVRLMLDGGANIEEADGDCNTPLNMAARYSQLEVAELLIARGANIEATTERGYTPIQFAKTKEMYNLLRKKGAKDAPRVV